MPEIKINFDYNSNKISLKSKVEERTKVCKRKIENEKRHRDRQDIFII